MASIVSEMNSHSYSWNSSRSSAIRVSRSLHACMTDAFVYLSCSWLSGSTDDSALCSSLLIIGQSGARWMGDNLRLSALRSKKTSALVAADGCDVVVADIS